MNSGHTLWGKQDSTKLVQANQHTNTEQAPQGRGIEEVGSESRGATIYNLKHPECAMRKRQSLQQGMLKVWQPH